MAHREAAARPERQVLAHAAFLPERVRHRVGLDRRSDRGVAEGQPADLPGRGHVAVEQHRGDRQHVGDVVEPVARLVRRQQRPLVDVQRQQIADRVAVLGAVQAMDRRPAGIRIVGGGAVEGRFQRGGGRVVGAGVRPRPARRGHGPRAQLAHDLLPGLDFPGNPARVLGVDGLQGQPGLPRAVVVARHAVAIQQRPWSGRRILRGRDLRARLGCGAKHQGETQTEPPQRASGRHAHSAFLHAPARGASAIGARPMDTCVQSLAAFMVTQMPHGAHSAPRRERRGAQRSPQADAGGSGRSPVGM